MQLVYCMFLVKIGVVLYTYNHSNMLISKFQSSMFTVSILRYANHFCNKIDNDFIVPTTKFERKYKIQQCILHTTYKLFDVCCMAALHFTNDLIITNATIVWTCERELSWIFVSCYLWRTFLPHKLNILHVNKNIPSTWT